MTEQEAFVVADSALCAVVDQILHEQWSLPIPDWFQTRGTRADLDLRQVVNYHAYDDAWVPDVLAGRTMAEVGNAFAGDLLGADPPASFRGFRVYDIAKLIGADATMSGDLLDALYEMVVPETGAVAPARCLWPRSRPTPRRDPPGPLAVPVGPPSLTVALRGR